MEISSLFDLIQKYDGMIGIASMLFIAWLGTKFVSHEFFKGFKTATDEHIKLLTDKVEATEDRLTIVEKDMQHLPDRGSFHRMEIAMEQLKGQLATIDERLKPIGKMVDRLTENEMDRAK